MSELQAKATGGLSRRAVIGAIGVFAIGAAGYAVWRRIPPDYDGGRLSVDAAHQAATDGTVLLIDIRTPREWRQTGVGEGAHPLDMRRDDFVATLSELADGDKARPIALICARGVRSARMSLLLRDAGFSSIIDVPEGMLGSGAGPGWIKAGLPVTKWESELS